MPWSSCRFLSKSCRAGHDSSPLTTQPPLALALWLTPRAKRGIAPPGPWRQRPAGAVAGAGAAPR
eukprot:scaffold2207_cov370-Prasinococcus_capsulatus_cf.AAC.10